MPFKIAITPGEPAGIGVDLCILLAQKYLANLYQQNIWAIIFADPKLIIQRAFELKQRIFIHTNDADFFPYKGQAGHILVQSVDLIVPCQTGITNPHNAPYVLQALQQAHQYCMTKKCDALVTGPVHKATIIQAGVKFTGHTEYLQQLAGVDKTVMTFYSSKLFLALATTHLPLNQVSSNITLDSLSQTILLLHHSLKQKFKLRVPKIMISGLNPHAGEDGCLGMEEQQVIIPVIKKLKQQGLDLTGPIPADTIFTSQYMQQADCILAMYHDQGLPVLKHLAFTKAVNLTLGLPYIRTSVDHGTALNLAGSGKIFSHNMIAAIDLAIKLI